MKKQSAKKNIDELRPEYDLLKLEAEFAASIIEKLLPTPIWF
jgi:hypothetical protein